MIKDGNYSAGLCLVDSVLVFLNWIKKLEFEMKYFGSLNSVPFLFFLFASIKEQLKSNLSTNVRIHT